MFTCVIIFLLPVVLKINKVILFLDFLLLVCTLYWYSYLVNQMVALFSAVDYFLN